MEHPPENVQDPAGDQTLEDLLRDTLKLKTIPDFVLGYNDPRFEDTEADIVKLLRTLSFSAVGGVAGTMMADGANAKARYMAEVGLVFVDLGTVHIISFGRLPVRDHEKGYHPPPYDLLKELLKQGKYQHLCDDIENVDASYHEPPGNAAFLAVEGSAFLFPFSVLDAKRLRKLTDQIGARELSFSLGPEEFAAVMLSQSTPPPEDLAKMAKDREYQQALKGSLIMSEPQKQIDALLDIRDYCPAAYAFVYDTVKTNLNEPYDIPVWIFYLLFPVAVAATVLCGFALLDGDALLLVIGLLVVSLGVLVFSYIIIQDHLATRKCRRLFQDIRAPER